MSVRWLALVTVVAGASARAQVEVPNEALVCPVDTPALDVPAYLRAASLDLRGAPPVIDELLAVEASDDDALALAEQMIDEWLTSPEFAARVVRRHRDLLWNSLGGIDLVVFRATLLPQPGDAILAQTTAPSRLLYRGDASRGCLDVPATFDAAGELVVDAEGREGYVEVEPYWAPGTTVKVCGFDAQAHAVGDTGARCGTALGIGDRGCGCGEGLRFCVTPQTEAAMRDALVQDLDVRIARNILDDAPYVDLLTERRAFVNGPLVHYWRNLAELTSSPSSTPVPLPLSALPDLPFTETELTAIDPGAGHSGILTSPAFLFRFQTNRARANRFFDTFLCQPFQPPDTGIDLSDPSAAREPDLQVRSGCKYCHAVLEPAAAHWGRFVEVGAGYLDSALFPKRRADCEACGQNGTLCSTECSRFYVTRITSESERPYLGQLKSYLFRRPEHERNIEEGPRHLVLASVVDDRLPRCVARSTAEWLLGRGLRTDEESTVDALTAELVSTGFSYRALVKAVITSETYRRVR